MKGALNQLFKTGNSSSGAAQGSAEDSSSWAWNVQQWKELLNSSLGTASLFPPRAPSAGAARERIDVQGEEMSLIKPSPHHVILAEATLLQGGNMFGDELMRERRLSDNRTEERSDNIQEPIHIHLQALRAGILRQVSSCESTKHCTIIAIAETCKLNYQEKEKLSCIFSSFLLRVACTSLCCCFTRRATAQTIPISLFISLSSPWLPLRCLCFTCFFSSFAQSACCSCMHRRRTGSWQRRRTRHGEAVTI
jgi:hypothetical protein